ncbi:MAG: bifunctional oligoribonuclease/PAP phosphatase NrnA [Bacilli bacterium]
MNGIYKQVYAKIKKFKTIYIARHIGPDPDAFSSQIALRDSIRLTFPNKEVYALGASVAKFKYIGKLDKVENIDTTNSLVITTDVPDLQRVDGIDILKCPNVIKIDHHPFVDDFGGIDLIDDECCSAAEVVLNLIKETKLKMDESIATTLVIGIISDSNRFLFSPVDYKTLILVANILKEYDLDLQTIYNSIYQKPLSELRLMGYIASNLKVTKNKFAYIHLEKDVISSLGADFSSASNMINDFNNINEILVWTFISYDEKSEMYKLNIRSRGPIINEIASMYNGGGHKYSSGARVKNKKDVDELLIKLENECIKFEKQV